MGENQKQPFQLPFNRFLPVRFQGSRVTSNGGIILLRELDQRLGFGELNRGAAPASGIHCNEPDAAESGGGAVL